MQLDVKALGDMIADLIAEAVEPLERQNAELRKEVDELKVRQPEKGDKGDPGRDADPVDTEAIADAVVSKLLDSERFETLADLKATEAVQKYMEANPPRDGKDGERGPQGEKGDPGKDGAGVADLLIDRDGNLVATMTDGRTKSLGVVVGKDGAPGRDGRDGSDLTELSLDFDGERTVVVRGKSGEVTKRLPVPLWRGYWSQGIAAEKGDVLTHNGTAYIAVVDNPKCEPGVGVYEHEWKVFARKGRDGRDGRNGIDKTKPVDLKKQDND